MKKIVMLFVLLICAVSLNAQDTISSIPIVDRYEIGAGIFKKNKVVEETIGHEYTLKVDSKYIQGEYLQRAGRNFTASGYLFLSSIVSGTCSVFIKNESLQKTCIVASGGLLVSSIVCFIVGSHQINRAGYIIKQNKKYIITTDGSSVKFKF